MAGVEILLRFLCGLLQRNIPLWNYCDSVKSSDIYNFHCFMNCHSFQIMRQWVEVIILTNRFHFVEQQMLSDVATC